MRAVLVAFGLIAFGGAPEANADRIFYRAGTWLETSSAVQRLSLLGVLGGWRQVAAEGEDRALAGHPLSRRQQNALCLTECLTAPAPRPVSEIQQLVTAFATTDPDGIFYSLSDFVAESLKSVCPSR